MKHLVKSLVPEVLSSAGTQGGYGLVAYETAGPSIEPENSCQRPKFAGSSPKFCRESDIHQISGSET